MPTTDRQWLGGGVTDRCGAGRLQLQSRVATAALSWVKLTSPAVFVATVPARSRMQSGRAPRAISRRRTHRPAGRRCARCDPSRHRDGRVRVGEPVDRLAGGRAGRRGRGRRPHPGSRRCRGCGPAAPFRVASGGGLRRASVVLELGAVGEVENPDLARRELRAVRTAPVTNARSRRLSPGRIRCATAASRRA